MEGTKKRNYDRAVATFDAAQDLAYDNNMDLVQHGSPWHFSLTQYKKNGNTSWILHLYPSKQRIYRDKHYKAPFLKLPRPWTFLDIVKAAIKVKEKK